VPRNATESGSKRLYAWRGEKFWSVTTIISGGLPKPALLPWGIKSVAEAAVHKRRTLLAMTSECETGGKCEPGNWCSSCDAAVRWLKSAPYQQRDKAADAGTKIHEAAEAYKLGKPMPPWPDDIAPTMAGFERWLTGLNPTFAQTEASVYNRAQRYAGTLDAIIEVPLTDAIRQMALGTTWRIPTDRDFLRILLDYKSGKAVYSEVALQLAAYRYAEFIGLPDGNEASVPEVDGAAALHLRPNGATFMDVLADDAVFRFFLYVREGFRWMEEMSKTVLGAELIPASIQEAA
jgi:hypothetical protein